MITQKEEKKTEQQVNLPWIEKYRPKSLEELVSQEEIVNAVTKMVDENKLTNILFYGPPGTGKTSTVLAAARRIFMPKNWQSRVLELNASDERGIDVVRNRIKEFARIAISAPKKSKESSIPLKIVILDEADAMTGAAQSALRRIMETETHNTRFFLICNYITRIIEPLTSRCAKFRFKPLSGAAQIERLLHIASKEGVKLEDGAIERLVDISGGDLRKSITMLQSMACSGHAISCNDIDEMSGRVPDALVKSLVDAASINHNEIRKSVKDFIKSGYSANQLISQLADVILQTAEFGPKHKAMLFEEIAESERRLFDGANDYLQILNFMLIFQECLMDAE